MRPETSSTILPFIKYLATKARGTTESTNQIVADPIAVARIAIAVPVRGPHNNDSHNSPLCNQLRLWPFKVIANSRQTQEPARTPNNSLLILACIAGLATVGLIVWILLPDVAWKNVLNDVLQAKRAWAIVIGVVLFYPGLR